MITCPYCGTSYERFQSNCGNCGAPLPPPPAPVSAQSPAELPAPPPAPRQIPGSYGWRLLFIDGWGITAGVFALLGVIFTVLGTILALSLRDAPVGLPFLGLGILFLIFGFPLLWWRLSKVRRTLAVLRRGETTTGQIVDVRQNLHVRVNQRHPWLITYRFQALGRDYEGQHSSLNQKSGMLQPGQPVYVLYALDDPDQNTLYLPYEQ